MSVSVNSQSIVLEKGANNICTLESHGCYNQNIMKHCRPEHDYRLAQFSHSILHPQPVC